MSGSESGTPRRIQWDPAGDPMYAHPLPDSAVFVGAGTAWANPFRTYEHCAGPDGDWGVEDTGRFRSPCGHGWTREGAQRAALDLYRRAFDERFEAGSSMRLAMLWDLHGHDLACACPVGEPCHADWLLEIAATECTEVFAAEPATPH